VLNFFILYHAAMTLPEFLQKIAAADSISFDETQSMILDNYQYQPVAFHNGMGKQRLSNAAGSNEGSCRIFAFAKIHAFNKAQTLNLFGEHYQHVLQNPHGSGHQNIRNFIKFGWAGIAFDDEALTPK